MTNIQYHCFVIFVIRLESDFENNLKIKMMCDSLWLHCTENTYYDAVMRHGTWDRSPCANFFVIFPTAECEGLGSGHFGGLDTSSTAATYPSAPALLTVSQPGNFLREGRRRHKWLQDLFSQ